MLVVQLAILAFCVGVVVNVLFHFPNPSPLIKPFLAPPLRWPERQVRGWLEKDRLDKGFLAFFTRDPERAVPSGDDLVSAADGVINDVFEKDGISYIVIALSFWDVHVQRSPIAGRVLDIRWKGDTFMDFEWQNAAFLKNKVCPVQAVVTLQTGDGDTVEVRLITSLAARRINVWVEKGQMLTKGQRLGNITFGSTVTVGVPYDWPVRVERRQRVVAGESVVASPVGSIEATAVKT